MSRQHRLAKRRYVSRSELETEVLSTYPVEIERLEGFSQFLLPAGITPKRHLTIETTDILLLLSAGAAWGHCRVG